MKPLPLFAALSLVMALSMPTTSAPASNLSVREAIKQVVPQVGPQLRKLAVAGRVAITAMCFATACAINFAAPTEATAANYLNSDAELLRSGDASSIFAEKAA